MVRVPACAVAFIAWSITASSPVRDLFAVPAGVAEFFLAATVFIIPLIDFALGKLLGSSPG
jgi:hypothetical protein